jgi:hypothetical protein
MPSVTLSKPVSIFGKTVGSVELKEPNGAMFVRLGEPRTLVFNASGSGYWVENGEAIRNYLDVLIVSETGGEAVMALLTLEDAVVVKETLFGFFTDAANRAAARRLTPSSSSSAS